MTGKNIPEIWPTNRQAAVQTETGTVAPDFHLIFLLKTGKEMS